MSAPIVLTLEGAEARIVHDGLNVLTDGRQWDMALSSGVGVDNVTRTGMLLPLPYTAAWQSRGDAEYARLRMSAYTVAGGTGSWYEMEPGFAGNYYLCSRGTVSGSAIVYTTQSYERNRGIYLSWYSPAAAVEQGTAIEFGWKAPGQSLSCRVLNNGDVEVWDGSTELLTGNVRIPNSYPGSVGPQGATDGASSAQAANKYNDLLAIPCRGRELLLMSRTFGGGFNVALDRLSPTDYDQTITEPGPIWWQVPSGQAIVQMAPMRFTTAGTLVSGTHWLQRAPGTVSGSVTLYTGTAGYGTVSYAGTVYGPSGTVAIGTADTQCRLGVVLTGDGVASPWVYGAAATWPATLGTTTATPTIGTVLARSTIRLDVDDDPMQSRMEFGLAAPLALEGSGLPLARTLSNRPVELSIGGTAWWWGRTEAPRWEEARADEARTLTIPCRDYWSVLEQYRMTDPVPMDGMNLGSAVAHLVRMAGFTDADLDIGSVDFSLERVGAESSGEWSLLPEVGDTPAEWLRRLRSDYAPTYQMGWRPGTAGPVFAFKSPEAVGSVAVGTVYTEAGLAPTWPWITGYSGTAGTTPVYGSVPHIGMVAQRWQEQVLPPEANDVWVIGANPRTRSPIVAHYSDAASMDPTLAGTARPTNWLGEPRRYSWVDQAITGTPTATWCAAQLAARLTVPRWVCEWESSMLLKADGMPVWVGDVVSLNDVALYRVTSMSVECELEAGDAMPLHGDGGVWRPTRYMAERLP